MTLARRNLPAIRNAEMGSASFIPHLDLEAVQRLIQAATGAHPRTGEQRDGLLIALLFDRCLRMSEAIRLRPRDLTRTGAGGWVATVTGKGNKTAQVALSASLAANLQSYAYRLQLPPDKPFFPVSRVRVHQILTEAFEDAGVVKPEHVGAVHVLRHSGAIARLEQTGNPKALQDQLRHQDARMTLKYLETISKRGPASNPSFLRRRESMGFGHRCQYIKRAS